MPRVHPIFSNFTAGELTPLLDARLDFAKYSNGAKILENFIIRPHGPVIRRPGSHYVAQVKDSSKNVRVLRFQFNVTQVYVLELGPGWIRFYSGGAQVVSGGSPLEVTNTYADADIFNIKIVQSADTIYFFHSGYPTMKLVRHSALNWVFKQVDWLPPPTKEVGQVTDVGSGTPWAGITATLSATSGTGVTVTASAAYFNNAQDVGRLILADDGVGIAVITGFTSTTVVTVDVVIAFTSVSLTAGPPGWRMAGTPQTTMTPSAVGAINGVVTLTAGAGAFLSTDVGRYVIGNKGVWKILAVGSSTSVTAIVLQQPVDATAVIAGNWTLEDPEWSALNGYPSVGMFYEGRLVAASTLGVAGVAGPATRPTSVWGSTSGQPENFARSSYDSGSFEFNIKSEQVNILKWIIGARELLMGTADGEMRMTGGSSSGSATTAITPTNVNVKAETGFGSADIRALRVNNAALFVTRSRKEIREYVYNLAFDAYVANDLTLLASHLTENHEFVDMDYQRTPHSIVWVVRSDGTLCSLTYLREHDVIGWARHVTGVVEMEPETGYAQPGTGFFRSVAVTPHWNLNGDVVWVVAERVVNGQHVKYVEYLDEQEGSYYSLYPFDSDDANLFALLVDAGVTYKAPMVGQNLTLSQAGLGFNVTAVSGGPAFDAGMVGWEIRESYGGVTGGRGLITGYTSATQVTVRVLKTFSSVSVLANNWLLAVTSVSGLSHLIGETVAMLGDGAVYPSAVVDNTGSISWAGLAPPADTIEAGLGYTSTLKTMRPEIPLQGTSQGVQRHWAKVISRLRHTVGGNVNGIDLPFRGSQDAMDVPPPVINGDVVQNAVEIDTDGFIIIKQEQPLPMTIVGIFGIQDVGES